MRVLSPAGSGGAVQPDAAVCGTASWHEGRRARGHQTVQEDHYQLLPALPGRALLLDHTHQVRTHLNTHTGVCLVCDLRLWTVKLLLEHILFPGCGNFRLVSFCLQELIFSIFLYPNTWFCCSSQCLQGSAGERRGPTAGGLQQRTHPHDWGTVRISKASDVEIK